MQKIAGKTVVVSTGELSREFHGMIELNETAAFIWRGLLDGKQPSLISKELAEECQVSLETAQSGVIRLIEEMKANGVVEDD